MTSTANRPVRRQLAPEGECPTCDQHRGRLCPPHDPSDRCRSGKHEHCSCGICF